MSPDGSNTAGSEGAALADALRAGNRAFAAHDYADAARHYARVVAVDGKCALAWYSLGNARWRRGDRTGAIEAYRRAVGEAPDRARAWQNLSTAHLSGNDWNEAAEAASKAVSLDPSRAKAWNNLAVARFALGDRIGAETALRRAVETDPKFAVAWANFARLLADVGRTDAARAAYERAISLGETDAAVRIGLAKALVTLGQGVEAESVLKDAVRTEPQSIDAWEALGDVRRSRSAPGPALEAYEAACAAGEDMSDEVRAKLANRRRHAAVELAGDALSACDRDGFTRAADRLREASGSVGEGLLDDATLAPAVERCLRVARERSLERSSPEWMAPDFVKGVLDRALASATLRSGNRSLA